MNRTGDILKDLDLFSEPGLREEIIEHCRVQYFRKGDTIVRQGQFVKVLPIVLSGMIRVFQAKEDREILLYYVEPGQTCMMSLSACFFNNASPSEAVAMENTEVLAVPTIFIGQWQKEYGSWNAFVIRTFRDRYDELLDSFASVVFDNMDRRILDYLQERARKQQDNKIRVSHQVLAKELGTTRVVISRILKQYEIEGKLTLRRGVIELV